MTDFFSDEYFMKEALKLAKEGLNNGEVPVGAIVVCNNQIIAKAHNLTETLNDVTAHAEILALTSAANHLGAKYLPDCTLYVTVEPCIMCAGASYWSQIGRIVYGTSDEKRGFTTVTSNILHPKTTVTSGILKDESAKILKDFFYSVRK
jgi:tRNA(adenine34) deaminase